jgi:asparagine synthase (glutamine-hydrolysing)
MCGICGFIDKTLSGDVAMRMVATLKHRGPDHQETKVYADQHCVMGHARLSIIDLSAAANQPMEYGDYAIVFNGEIYNFRDIRKELERLGHRFRLDSDTEVILHAYQEWGAKCVDKFVGMFAFAILDKAKDELVLFRDRAGVKPLYYYADNGTFLFASELKAFYEHPAFRKELDMEAVGLYFKYGYIPAPHAIYQRTKKLLQGHYLVYHISTHEIFIHKYWDVLDFYHQPKLTISYDEAKEQLESILNSAFNYRMVADVPVGVFLSGGYDSAGLTAILQKDRTERLKTFTIGFPVGNNEAPVAKEIAKYLGTDHTEYICMPDDCKKIVAELPFYFDEPFSDNSAVPTILVSRLARKDVKVALSADGGDETFAGYNRYAGLYGVLKYLNMLKPVKSGLLSHMAGSLSSLVNPYSFYREKGEYLSRLLKTEQKYRVGLTAEGGAFSTLSETMYGEISSLAYPDPMYLLDEKDYSDPISLAMAMDYINYMPNDILVKVDRATMSTSLEGRDPLLDHRIIEFAAQLPISYKFDHGNKKRIYKDILYQYVPKAMMDRPKSGFMMPVDEWLRGDLKYLLEENLDATLSPEFFNVENVKKMKSLFYQNKLGHENKTIWRILEFQLWYKYNM